MNKITKKIVTRHRNIKILATIGPSCTDPKIIRILWENGVDCFRLNMSHTSHESFTRICNAIRALEAEVGSPIGILVDLQGPKLRIGEMQDGVMLNDGQDFQLSLYRQEVGNSEVVGLPHEIIFDSVQKDHVLLLDDGKIQLRVTEVDHKRKNIDTKVVFGGVLLSRKGVNLPNTLLSINILTNKDMEDLYYALDSHQADWIALSFVQTPNDISFVKEIVKKCAWIMAKIEKPQAITHIDSIVRESDGLMIARGDLGVEIPLKKVPGIQKRLITVARMHGKPVVVATQMLESMITSSVPTRAEVSDVAQAVYEGADAIMLSAETASGAYPTETVAMMNNIAIQVEQEASYTEYLYAHSNFVKPLANNVDAISVAVFSICEVLPIKYVVCYTNSGDTGRRMARQRPMVPIIALTHMKEIARRLTLVWGLRCVYVEKDPSSIDDIVVKAVNILKRHNKLYCGDMIVVTAGVPIGTSYATNLLRIIEIGNDIKTINDIEKEI